MLRGFRNLVRLGRIALTLARHDALFVLERLGIFPVLVGIVRRWWPSPAEGRPGERLARGLIALGPSFIKLGQALSIRPDLIGEDLAADLARLQDRLPPFPGAEARAAVASALEQPVDALFRRFDDRAVAAASIAQVHFAETADGTEVAVKILRPGIEAQFARDLDLFHWLAGLVERYRPELRRLKPVEVVETFAQSIRLEMDLRLEAAAASELAENFRGDPAFRVPRVDWTRTAKRVLTLERVQGIKVDDVPALLAAGHDPRAVVGKAATVFFAMVFRDGFFHADLHPGNLFVGAEGELIAVDFGIMGRLDRATRIYLADMLIGFLGGDYRSVAEVHFDAGYVPASQSVGAFTQATRAIAEPILNRPLNEISLARLLAQLFEVTEAFQMETQPQLLLLQKSMLVCEGVGRLLDPEINMWTLARPLIEDWVRANRGPQARVANAVEGTVRRVEQLPALFDYAQRALERLGDGGVRLHPETLAALRGEGRGRAWPWALAGAALVAILWAVL